MLDRTHHEKMRFSLFRVFWALSFCAGGVAETVSKEIRVIRPPKKPIVSIFHGHVSIFVGLINQSIRFFAACFKIMFFGGIISSDSKVVAGWMGFECCRMMGCTCLWLMLIRVV